jgi:hypothetical protein
LLEQHHNGVNGSYNLLQFGLFLRETFEKTLMHYKKAMTSFSLAANDLKRLRYKHINKSNNAPLLAAFSPSRVQPIQHPSHLNP